MGNRSLRLPLSCAITLLLCGGAFFIGGYSLGWYRAQRSRELTEGLRQLQVGQTTEAEVRKLAKKYGGKYRPPSDAQQNSLPQPAHYDFEISSPCVTIGESTHAFPGPRLWTIAAHLYVEDGRLARLSSSQFVSRSDDFMLSTNVEFAKKQQSNWVVRFRPLLRVRGEHDWPSRREFWGQAQP